MDREPTDARRLADSYIDHILIALEVGDIGAPFRDFFDNWYAYRIDAPHHRTRGGRPRWFNNPSAITRRTMLHSLDFRSAAAAAILEKASADPTDYERLRGEGDKTVRLVVDHAVPIGCMVTMLMDLQVRKRESVEAFLQTWYRLGLISHEENTQLAASKLEASMPCGWDKHDPFARYHKIGLRQHEGSIQPLRESATSDLTDGRSAEWFVRQRA